MSLNKLIFFLYALTGLFLTGPLTIMGSFGDAFLYDLSIDQETFVHLKTIGVLVIALAAPTAPLMVKWIGFRSTFTGALFVLLIGSVLRLTQVYLFFYVGTLCVVASIGYLVLILPVLAKHLYGKKAALALLIYTIFIPLSAAIGTSFSLFNYLWQDVFKVYTLVAFALSMAWGILFLNLKPEVFFIQKNRQVGIFNLFKQILTYRLTYATTLMCLVQTIAYYVLTYWEPIIKSYEGFSEVQTLYMLLIFLLFYMVGAVIFFLLYPRWGDLRRLSIINTIVLLLGVFCAIKPSEWSLYGFMLLGLGHGIYMMTLVLITHLKTANPTSYGMIIFINVIVSYPMGYLMVRYYDDFYIAVQGSNRSYLFFIALVSLSFLGAYLLTTSENNLNVLKDLDRS